MLVATKQLKTTMWPTAKGVTHKLTWFNRQATSNKKVNIGQQITILATNWTLHEGLPESQNENFLR
jgi:hypothetical protein